MNEIKQIDVEKTIAAFDEFNVIPHRSTNLTGLLGLFYGCVDGVLYLMEGGETKVNEYGFIDVSTDTAMNYLMTKEYDQFYLRGLFCGFDFGTFAQRNGNRAYALGHIDGYAVAKQVFANEPVILNF